MKVAVLTMARDRLEYTKRSFASLKENAGCRYDHFVLDNGSKDGTWDWLTDKDDLFVVNSDHNVGISAGMNYLLDLIRPMRYDRSTDNH